MDLCLPLIAPIIPPGTLVRLSAITVNATIIVVIISREFTAGMIAERVAGVTFIFAQQLQLGPVKLAIEQIFIAILLIEFEQHFNDCKPPMLDNGLKQVSNCSTLKINESNTRTIYNDTFWKAEGICLIIAVDVRVAAYLIVSQSIAVVFDYSTHPVCCRRRVTLVCKSFCKSFTAVLSETKNTAIAFNFCELEKSLSPIPPPPLPSNAVSRHHEIISHSERLESGLMQCYLSAQK
uniref:Uncharacterized protein n=1 Tax=Glossina pallidipes TaxID=7398 RepID=A0A1B0ADZ7_GLOPL